MYKARVSRGFWSVVKDLMVQNYSLLENERLRQGYYIIRNALDPLIGKRITRQDFDYFAGLDPEKPDQAYSYYTQDAWTHLERKGYKRPEAKPSGSLWVHGGVRVSIEDFWRVWDQARGFIFTEKSGEKLERLTMFGWVIIEPDKGFPTRRIREKCKQDGRPVIAVHDADESGTGIFRALGHETIRTTHLDIAIDDVTDLGLRWEDVKRLGLPVIPEVDKHKKTRSERCELESLVLLTTKHGIENPFLNYVLFRMAEENITISPTETEKRELLKSHIVSSIVGQLEGLVYPVVDEFVDGLEFEPDKAVSVFSRGGGSIELDDLEDIIKEISSKMEKNALWKYESDYDTQARELISAKFLSLIAGNPHV